MKGNTTIGFRINEADRRGLYARAASLGMSVGAYIVQLYRRDILENPTEFRVPVIPPKRKSN